ncbi:hypothetical protein ASPWEDRAFT_39592 [Aspergillus wentii DTO 134E9]|uniref:Uncharacterized protein n=1 Tax=Aspergillus wentii DTO 134E9 TaxID=1073089 RepID=A0A1L9RSS4_ASPWE|nr:uncharacterized protein ASPWEDRAFT_39592 [Aspergillus wentii DTO 134E9]OJJ37867.1 hypothetical protein ASPWEDRAFT_39592 [Aspergillus wentii DTO 134E9]
MDPPLTFPSRTEFHKALINANVSTTDQWDVVASYSQEKLQPLLKKYWSEKIGPTSISLPPHRSGHGRHALTTTYTLDLSAPHFEFEKLKNDAGSTSMARITWAFTGTSDEVDKQNTHEKTTLTAEDGFSLSVLTPLYAIGSGTEDISKAKTSHEIIDFSHGVHSSYKITLQFQNTEATTWTVHYKGSAKESSHATSGSKTDSKDDDKQGIADELNDAAKDIAGELNNKSRVKGFRFTLGEVKNTPNPKDYVLTPEKFQFTVDRGILSIFINVKGGDGKGNSAPQFKLAHDNHFAPMPKGYDASIILSKNLIRDKYMIPQIQEKCGHMLKDHGGVTTDDGLLGPSVKLKFNNGKVWSGFKTGGGVITEGHIDIDWDNYPLVLTLFDDSSTLEPRYKWKWDNALVTLTYWNITPKAGRSRDHTTSMHASIPENSSPVATFTNNDHLEFKIAFTEKNQPNAKFTDIGGAGASGSVSFQTFDMNLPDINFFRTQNVVAPGEDIITPKSTMCPCDLFIFGSMESK